MGVAYYPVFDKEIAGYDPSVEVSGKAMARAMETLDQIAQEHGVAAISSFFSESNEESFESIGEEVPEDMEDEPIQWTAAQAGTQTIDFLLTYLANHPELIDLGEKENGRIVESARRDAVQSDLTAFRKVLIKATEHGAKFRLRLDI